MPRVNIPLVLATPTGAIGPSISGDIVNGHILTLDNGVILHIYNNDSVDHTVTIYIPELIEGQAVSNMVVTVAPMENLWLGNWEGSSFPTGYLEFDVDSANLKINAVLI